MPLLDVPALASRLGDPRLRICDVRWSLTEPGRRAYEEGHLPGAVFVDVETDLTAPEGPGRHPLPSPAVFAATLGRLGIAPGDMVVAYDAAGGASAAARLWWMLRSLGHADVFVLDGGLPAWTAAGLPLETDPAPAAPTSPYPVPETWTGVVDAAGAAAATVLVDARAPARYRGEIEPVDPRAGHIPGSLNVPYEGNVDGTGAFLPRPLLAERYAGVGDDPVVYCGSGITACHDLLALAVLGRSGRLYEGSWSDWCSDPDRPAVVGPSLR